MGQLGAGLSATAADHFKLVYYAAVLHVVERLAGALGSPEAVVTEFPFLGGYCQELERLGSKRLLFFVGGLDRGHWLEGAERGLEGRREVFGLQRLACYADQVRLVVIPGLTHYGHIEAHNERLANLFVAGLAHYLMPQASPATP